MQEGTTIQSAGENETLLPAENIVARQFDPMSSLPVAAAILFSIAIDPKKSEQIALAASMVSATTLPVISHLLQTSKSVHQHIETLSSALMTAAVAMMGLGAIKTVEQSDAAKVGLTAIACFSIFATVNAGYNLLKSLGIIQSDKPLVEFIANGAGLVGSILFLATQVMNYETAKHANNADNKKAAGLLIAASCFFAAATGHGSVNAARRTKNQPSEPTADINSMYGATSSV